MALTIEPQSSSVVAGGPSASGGRLVTIGRWVRRARQFYVVLFLICVWELAIVIWKPESVLVPGPWPVALAFAQNIYNGALPAALGYSLRLISEGFGAGIVAAVILAMLGLFSGVGRALMETLISLFNPLPAVALVPLALLWFGIGTRPILFVIMMSVVWPAAINIYSGFASISPTLRRVGLNFGLRGVRLIARLMVPAALPSILSGMRVAWAFAWRTAISAELIFGVAGQHGGLGYFIYNARYYLETADMVAGLVVIMLIGIVVEKGIFGVIEKRTVKRWGMSI